VSTTSTSAVHAVSPGRYLAVFASLVALTLLTVFAARTDLGILNPPVALGIAVVKATLVVLFFMHALDSPRLTRLVIVGAVLWLVILLVLTSLDYVSRGWLGHPGT
jgi:cytochrome c oxidase subunit 4